MAIIRPATRQHTVSQVVLRRFTVRRVMTIYDARRQMFLDKGPRAGFYMPFDTYDPYGSEALWAPTENRTPAMYAALDSRCAIGDPNIEDIIRDVIALHWARSPAMKVAHERVTEGVLNESIAHLGQQPELLGRHMVNAMGIHPGGPESLDWFNRDVHRRVANENQEQWWSDRNTHHFVQAKEMFRKWSVQVGYAPPGTDLVIGDSPVLTVKSDHQGVGPHQGVALGDASEICMPASPTMLLGLGPAPATLTLTTQAVDRYNDLQRQASLRWLGCRPSGPSDAELRATQPVKPAR